MGPKVIIIPARLGARRLPNKPLLDLGGLPLVIRVAQQALRCRRLSGFPQLQDLPILVATDSQEIMDTCAKNGIDSMNTKSSHHSGSDRVAEAATQLGLSEDAVVLNLQGDEPFIEPKDLARLLQHMLEHDDLGMGTLATPIRDPAIFHDPNVVKVVRDEQGHALYFSRAPIPAPRDTTNSVPLCALQHIGVYAYRMHTLNLLCASPLSALEEIEHLEQLRALEQGVRIQVLLTPTAPLGIDSIDDLEQARALWRATQTNPPPA